MGRISKNRRMHRIATVRQRQGVSLRSVAKQMGVDIRQLRQQEDETSDVSLSTIYAWQKVLDVPISELLVDPDDALSPLIKQRAEMVKIMKTVATIRERSKSAPIQRLAQRLVDAMVSLMPELKEVGPWPSVGQRRTREDYGRIVERQIPEEFLGE